MESLRNAAGRDPASKKTHEQDCEYGNDVYCGNTAYRIDGNRFAERHSDRTHQCIGFRDKDYDDYAQPRSTSPPRVTVLLGVFAGFIVTLPGRGASGVEPRCGICTFG
jgi:hypothetical protein